MQCSLLIYQTDDQFGARADPERREAKGGAFSSAHDARRPRGLTLEPLTDPITGE